MSRPLPLSPFCLIFLLLPLASRGSAAYAPKITNPSCPSHLTSPWSQWEPLVCRLWGGGATQEKEGGGSQAPEAGERRLSPAGMGARPSRRPSSQSQHRSSGPGKPEFPPRVVTDPGLGGSQWVGRGKQNFMGLPGDTPLFLPPSSCLSLSRKFKRPF